MEQDIETAVFVQRLILVDYDFSQNVSEREKSITVSFIVRTHTVDQSRYPDHQNGR